MIASFSHDFIFLKTRKTGGTSVALVLSTLCKQGDILSPLYAPDEERRRQMGGWSSTNSIYGERVTSHMTAYAVKSLFPNLWDRAIKISIERHPYEKVVSRAYWNMAQKGLNPDTSLRAELDASVEDPRLIDREIYCINGERVVDIMLLQENLENDMKLISQHFGKELPPLPNSKSHFRIDPRPARQILTKRQMERIRERTEFEFSEFGFQP